MKQSITVLERCRVSNLTDLLPITLAMVSRLVSLTLKRVGVDILKFQLPFFLLKENEANVIVSYGVLGSFTM